MKKLMERNIKLLFAIRALRSTLIAIPVIVPFFQENGLSQTEIFILQSVFAIGVLVLEVPSGYFADHYGRKKSMLLGGILATLGFIIYSFAFGFWPILIAELVLGVGLSFISGADTAIAYDSLAAIGKKETYRRFEARSFAFSGTAEASASILGGILALISLRTTIYAQVGVELVLIPLTLLLVEPKRIKSATDNPFKDVLRITKYALHGHKEIKWLILYGATVGTLTHTMVWLTQPYYQLVGIPIGWFGVLWAVQLLAMAVFAQFADTYEQWLGKRKALSSFVLIGVAAYILLGVAPWVATLPVLLVFYFIRGVHVPILRDYVNSLIDSDFRATVMSVSNLVQKLLYTLIGPLIGVVMDLYSLQTALLFSAVVYGSLGLIVLTNMKRLKHL